MPPMPLLKLTARLVVDTIIGLAAVPMSPLGKCKEMPPVAVNTGAVMPVGVIEKILPAREVRVI